MNKLPTGIQRHTAKGPDPVKPSRRIFRSILLPALGILAAILPLFSSTAAAAPLVLATEQRYSLAGHLEILVDTQRRLSLQEVLAATNQARFVPVPGFVNRSYTDDAVWIRLSVLRAPGFPHDPVLRLWPPFLDHLDAYVQTGDDAADPASYQLYRLGDHIPTAQRPIIDVDFAVPLVLPENRPRSVYLMVQTTSSLNLSAHIHTEPDYITYGSMNAACQGGYLATTLIIALINLVLFIRLRDRLYLYFALYVLSLFTTMLPTSGLMTLYWPSRVHLLSDYFTGLGASCGNLFIALFGMQLFARAERPWVRRFFTFVVLISLLTIGAVFLEAYNHFAPYMFSLSLVMICVLTGLSLIDLMQGIEEGGLYLAAFGITNIGYTVQILRLLGVLPVAWWNLHAVQVASLVNMVLMTIAMTERVRRAEKTALKAAREAEKSAVELAGEMTRDLRIKQKSLEEALSAKRSALESQNRFLEVVTHEYRTPLAIIRANIDIMEMKACSAECSHQPYINKIKHAISRLVEVLEATMGKERMAYSRLEMNCETLELVPFLESISHDASMLWSGRRIDFSNRRRAAGRVSGDRALLKTAVFNLLDNACKYSREHEPVRVELDIGNTEVSIEVSDHGRGIPAEERDQVFEKYFRGDNSSNVSGAGLGLYLVRKIVIMHGGRVTISADTAGGTAARITLPLADREATLSGPDQDKHQA